MDRSFILGSEWLYYKIYTGPKTADFILASKVLPLTKGLVQNGLVKKWFFIRYFDPDYHLRLRFHLDDKKEALPEVVDQVYETLNPLLRSGMVWKVSLDTYNRELERYGDNTIEYSEAIFYHDSHACLRFLDMIEGEEGERLRWLYGLRAIDNLLSAFEYGLENKLQLLEILKTSFGREFGMSRPLKKQLDAKFRQNRSLINNFMVFTREDNPDYEPVLEVLSKANSDFKKISKNILELDRQNSLKIEKNDLMSSYIHMIMNRLFKSKNRLNEMVSYDFLFRYYKSRIALNRQSQITD